MSTTFNFPANPTLNQQVILPNGAIAQWNGTEWVSVGDSTVTYPLPVLSGGTGSSTAAGARINLGLNAATGEFIVQKDGTAAAPGIAFASEPGLGILRPAAGVIDIRATTLQLNGVPFSGAGRLLNVQVFGVGSGTYTPTPGTKSAIAELIGAGGGGGGNAAAAASQVAAAGGGGAGAYARHFITGSVVASAYVVGAAGAGGGGPGRGGDGGQTVFLGIVAGGGGGGDQGAAANAGIPSGGLSSGGPGGTNTGNPSNLLSCAGMGGGIANSWGAVANSGFGGAGPYGGGGQAQFNNYGAHGAAYGAGGGGSASIAGYGARGGGNGGNGVLIIYEYA